MCKQIIIYIIAVIISMPISQSAAYADDRFELRSAESLHRFSTYDSIITRNKESVIFPNGGQQWATYIVLLLPRSYDRTIQLLPAIKKVFAPDDVQSSTARVGLRRLKPDSLGVYDSTVVNAEIDKDEKSLVSSGLRLNEFNQILLSKKVRYEDGSGQDYSELYLRVIDGEAISGRRLTLLLLSRVDHSKEWGRLAHTPLILPMKVDAVTRVVTSTELKIVRDLKENLATPGVTMILLQDSRDPFESFSSLLHIQNSINGGLKGSED